MKAAAHCWLRRSGWVAKRQERLIESHRESCPLQHGTWRRRVLAPVRASRRPPGLPKLAPSRESLSKQPSGRVSRWLALSHGDEEMRWAKSRMVLLGVP